MLALMGISGLICFTVSGVLGVRLVRLWRQSRQTPELAIGLSFLSAGVFGWAFMLSANFAGDPSQSNVGVALFSGGYLLISLGVVLSYLFTWQVFRPTEIWARALFWCTSAILLLTAIPFQLPQFDALMEIPGFALVNAAGTAARIGSGVWGATEAFLYWRQMRRRASLGMAEPLVANRFLLWFGASASTALIMTVTSLSPPTEPQALTPLFAVGVSTFATAAGIQQYFAFMPPEFYRRFIAKRSQRAEA
jgi:hypothetical protein